MQIRPGEAADGAAELRKRARVYREAARQLPGVDGRGYVGAECLLREAASLDRVAEWIETRVLEGV